MKNLKSLGKTLNKQEQQKINGGNVNPRRCQFCGGFPFGTRCLISSANACCLTGSCE